MAGFNPFVDPATQAQIDRQRQLALMLQQSSMQPNEGQMVSGHYIAPALTQNIAKLLQGYSAQKMQAKSDVQQSDLWKNQMAGSQAAFGLNGTGQQDQPADAPDVQAMGAGATAAPNDAQNNNMGGVGPTPQNAALASLLRAQTPQAAPQPAQPSASSNPAVPDGYTPQAAWLLSQTNPELYQTLVKQTLLNRAPTDTQKDYSVAFGGDRTAMMGALQAKQKKDAYIAPASLRGQAYMGGDGQIHSLPDAAQPGFMNQFDPATNSWSTAPIKGGLDAVTQAAAALKAGQNQQTLTPAEMSPTLPNGKIVPSTIANTINGVQGNNPGNLRPAGASTGFQQFSSPADGLAAIDKNLQSYGKQGANTVSSIISKWAPPSENNTQAYIADVSQRLGIKPDQKLDMTNPVVRQALSTAIAIHENGSNKLFASQEQPPQGVGPAFGQKEGAVNAQAELSKKYGDLQQQNSQAQITSSYLQNIKQQAQKAAVGPMSDRIDFANGLLSLVGSQKATDKVTANDLLDKYSNQIVSRLGTGGLGTDAARSILQAAYPGAHMNLQAINEAADNLVGANEMIKAKTALLSPHGNARDPAAYQQKEQVFDQNADPRLWQYKAMQPGSPQAKAFLQGVIKQDPQFIEKAKALKGIGAL